MIVSFAKNSDNLFLMDNARLSHKILNQKLLNNEILVAKSDKKSTGPLILDCFGIMYLLFHLFGLMKSIDG